LRDYAKVAPQFWTGRTGKLIRAAARLATVPGKMPTIMTALATEILSVRTTAR